MHGMTFNGIKKDYVTTLRGKRRPAWAPLKRNLLSVEGMAGAHVESTDIQPRPINVPIVIESTNLIELQKMKEELADWLVTDEAKELIFDDEPDRVYFAMVDGDFDPEEIVKVGYGVINFICPDPYKYGSENSTDGVSSATFNVSGTVNSDPIIQCQVNEDTTFLSIGNGSDVNLVGIMTDVGDVTVDPETKIFASEGDNLIGWVESSSESIEEVPIGGTLKTNGAAFYVDDYGSFPTYWHGPSMKKSISEALTDFRIDVDLLMSVNYPNEAGIIMVFLLDANSQAVARLMLTKRYPSSSVVTPEFRAGTRDNKFVLVKEGDGVTDSSTTGYYNYGYFDGMLRLSRIKNQWTAKIFFKDLGGNYEEHYNTWMWTDTQGIAPQPVTQVQVRILQREEYRPIKQHINFIRVYRVNDVTEGQIPIIARAGDIIEFNHQNDIIKRNGEDITKDKAFIGKYFTLNKGQNTIVAEPADSISSINVRWRDRWR